MAGAPQNTVIGGASLWVMSGKKPAEVQGRGAVLQVPVRAARCRPRATSETGYLPITIAAYKLTEQSGFYKQNPGTDVAVNQMIRKTTDKSRGIRLGNFVQIRTIIDEELEQVWAGKKSAKQGLDDISQARQRELETVPGGQQGLTGLTTVAVEKRVRFRSGWLPWALVAPQAGHRAGLLLLAGGAGGCTTACCSRTPSAPASSSSAWRTSARCSVTTTYLASFRTTAVFSVLVAGLGLSLVAAAGGDGRPRGQGLGLATRRC